MSNHMRKMYNVLWIDDEWEKMLTFKDSCKIIHGLNLEPYSTCKAGMEALDKDLSYWDAVLLDARMLDENENEIPNIIGLRKAIDHLNSIKLKRYIPYFISTGDHGTQNDETFRNFCGKFYKKGVGNEKCPGDYELITDMICAIEKSEATQMEIFYENVFSALEFMKIKESCESILIDILLALHYPANHTDFKPIHHYNQLRRLVENLFRVCNEHGIIPNQCIEGGKVNLNQCSIYLAGKPATHMGIGLKDGARIVPVHIESIIRLILEFGNTHSHTVELDENDKAKIDAILRTEKSRYIIFGLALQLCEVITWLSDYIESHPDKEKNLSKCQKIGQYLEYEGKIFEPEQDEDGIWHCKACKLSMKNWNGGKVRLKSICDNTDKDTNAKYPLFAYYDKEQDNDLTDETD